MGHLQLVCLIGSDKVIKKKLYLRSAKQKESVDGSGKNDANAEDSDIVKRQEEGVHATTLKAADLRKYGCIKKAVVNGDSNSTGFVR